MNNLSGFLEASSPSAAAPANAGARGALLAITRRKVRARNRLRVACADLPFAYRLDHKKGARIEFEGDSSRRLDRRPAFSGPASFAGTSPRTRISADRSESVDRQLIPRSEARALETTATSTGLLIAPTVTTISFRSAPATNCPKPRCFHFAEALQRNPAQRSFMATRTSWTCADAVGPDLVQAAWNEELFLAQDYLSAAVAIEGSSHEDAAIRQHQATVRLRS